MAKTKAQVEHELEELQEDVALLFNCILERQTMEELELFRDYLDRIIHEKSKGR